MAALNPASTHSIPESLGPYPKIERSTAPRWSESIPTPIRPTRSSTGAWTQNALIEAAEQQRFGSTANLRRYNDHPDSRTISARALYGDLDCLDAFLGNIIRRNRRS
jgi:hypothetical protein